MSKMNGNEGDSIHITVDVLECTHKLFGFNDDGSTGFLCRRWMGCKGVIQGPQTAEIRGLLEHCSEKCDGYSKDFLYRLDLQKLAALSLCGKCDEKEDEQQKITKGWSRLIDVAPDSLGDLAVLVRSEWLDTIRKFALEVGFYGTVLPRATAGFKKYADLFEKEMKRSTELAHTSNTQQSYIKELEKRYQIYKTETLSLNMQLENAATERTRAMNQLIALENKYNGLMGENNRLSTLISTSETEKQTLEQKLSNICDDHLPLVEQIISIEKKNVEYQLAMEVIEEKVTKLIDSSNIRAIRLTAERDTAMGLVSDTPDLTTKLSDRIAKLEKEYADHTRDLKDLDRLERRNKALEEEIDLLAMQINFKAAEMAGLKKDLHS